MTMLSDRAIVEMVFAETATYTTSPDTDGQGLREIRSALAGMIMAGGGGGFVHFSRGVDPGTFDAPQRSAWDECVVAVGKPRAPDAVALPNGGTALANAAFFGSGNPLHDSSTMSAHPWLANAPEPIQIGRARNGNVDVEMWVTIAPPGAGVGRFPRLHSPVAAIRIAAEELPQIRPGGFDGKRVTGGVCFMLVLAVLIAQFYVTWHLASRAETDPKQVAVIETARSEEERLKAAYESASKAAESKAPDSLEAKEEREAREALERQRNVLSETRELFPALTGLWLWSIAGMFLVLALVSWGSRSQVLGFLVDERERMSLSRLQLAAWTIVILSAYWTSAAWNLGSVGWPSNGALLPSMPEELWAALGLVAFLPVGSSLIMARKPQQGPTLSQSVAEAGVQSAPQAGPQSPSDAPVERRTRQDEWSFVDLFKGEYITNNQAVDLTRLQQFLFTLILIGTYSGLLFGMFGHVRFGEPIQSLPELTTALLGLLAISHATYYAGKLMPKPLGHS